MTAESNLRTLTLEHVERDTVVLNGEGNGAAACAMLEWCDLPTHVKVRTNGKTSRRMTATARFIAGGVRAGGGQVVTASATAQAAA